MLLLYHIFIFYGKIRIPRGVAQLVEHRSPKPGVASSSLAAPAIFFAKKFQNYNIYDKIKNDENTNAWLGTSSAQ